MLEVGVLQRCGSNGYRLDFAGREFEQLRDDHGCIVGGDHDVRAVACDFAGPGPARDSGDLLVGRAWPTDVDGLATEASLQLGRSPAGDYFARLDKSDPI